ncbi:MAG: universal stress protein [Geminicoccaceae bacterium]
MYKHILLPLDVDQAPTWEKALPMALDLAKRHEARLTVMTVVPSFGSSIVSGYFPEGFEEKALERARAELRELVADKIPADVPHDMLVAHGRIWQEICRVAEKVEADLIVMASHKPSFSDILLQPNASQVLHHAPMSVLIAR